jgi:hypothetical protein
MIRNRLLEPSTWMRRALVSVALMAAPTLLRAQAITGKVTDVSGNPLTSVSVVIEGTALGALTREDGTYRIAGVQPGTRSVVARRVGYTPGRQSVNVTTGDVTVNFQLATSAVSLEAVATTATGQQRQVELGNAVATVDVALRAQTAPVKSIGDLLNAQATGVTVTPGTQTGAATRVRIRAKTRPR